MVLVQNFREKRKKLKKRLKAQFQHASTSGSSFKGLCSKFLASDGTVEKRRKWALILGSFVLTALVQDFRENRKKRKR
jgi:hypothetical protein